MENAIQEVYNAHFGKVRVVVINGAIYLVGKDVAAALEFKDTRKAVAAHVQSQDKITFRGGESPCQFQSKAVAAHVQSQDKKPK